MEQLISKLPLPLQDPLLAITDSFGNLGPRLVAKLGMGNQLLDAAVRYNIPSARKYARLTRERGAIVERKQEAYVRWAEAHNKLPAQYRGTGEGTVNGLIQRMTQEDKWAFIPNYFRGEDKDASIILDQELAAEFNAMPREAQAVVVEAFRLNYDTLKDSQQSVLEMTASEYDALIANATSEKDRVAYEKAKADSLKQYERLLRIDPTTPYAPLSRYGKWVVIGKSDAFIAAQEADNRTEIERLQSDPNHYFVDYADTRAEAARMQREIINTYGGNPRNAQIAQRSDAEESMYGGRDMMYAFQRLNSMIERESMSPEIAKQLRKRVVEMQLMAMANTSARKAELRRRNIASGDLDMVQIILSRGRATAHFIGSVYKNKEIVDAIGDMRKEVKVNDGKREERQAIYNGILARYVDGMTAAPENSLSDSMTSLTSFWMLGLAPSYYLQQAMQNMMITVPFIASRHGYDETFAAMRAGYKQVMKAWSDGGVLDQLDVNKVDPKYRALANYLAESGELDVGINKEMGTLAADSGGAISNTMKRVTDSVRALTRKIEAINRLSAGIAMYELELAADRKGKKLERSYDTGAYQSYLNDFAKAYPLDTPLTETQFAAANNALRVVTDTHGNYGYENTPVFLRGPVARVVGQFQKFRIILAGLYIREINNWIRGTTPEDRAVARRAVLYMSGHAAIAGGLIGSPVAAVFALVYNAFAGSEDEREDMERDIRQAIGDPTIANLLLKGLPTLAGVDMSGTLGQGTILSVAPYTDLPTDRDSYAKYILSLTGPAIGGIGGNLFDAVSLASDGNYYKAMEKVMPRGVGGALRSLREALGGETNTANELLVSPVELSAVESFWGTIGFQPIDRANRQFARNQFYKDQKFYQDRVSDVKRAYVEAFRAKDTEKMQQLRGEWKQLQQVREQRGLKPQPLLQLLSAPREVARQEQRTVGGVQFGPSTERQARELAGLTGG